MITYIIIQTIVGIIVSTLFIVGSYKSSDKIIKCDRQGELLINIGIALTVLFLIDVLCFIIHLYPVALK